MNSAVVCVSLLSHDIDVMVAMDAPAAEVACAATVLAVVLLQLEFLPWLLLLQLQLQQLPLLLTGSILRPRVTVLRMVCQVCCIDGRLTAL